MRNKLFLLIFFLCSLFIGVNRAEANDFLELEKHYSAYPAYKQAYSHLIAFSLRGQPDGSRAAYKKYGLCPHKKSLTLQKIHADTSSINQIK